MSLLLLLLLLLTPPTTSAVNFLLNPLTLSSPLLLLGDAVLEPTTHPPSAVLRLTNDSNPTSFGRAFHPHLLHPLTISTSFVFSILPQIQDSPGFGLAFVLSNTTTPPGFISAQYFGLFSNSTHPPKHPLLAVEFDTGRNPEFNDPDGNHVGIDLNSVISATTASAGYHDNSTGRFVPVDMRSGRNIRAWIEFDVRVSQINVTIAPVGVPKPTRPLISYTDPAMVDYLSDQMFVGFSASKVQWVEAQRVLAWSFSDAEIGTAREINTSDLPVFLPTSNSSNSSLSAGAIAGISSACVVLGLCLFGLYYWFRIKNKKGLLDSEEEFEEWEMNYWPHRFSYEELYNATKGFSIDGLLGFGGFGKVYKGVLPEAGDVAVKCVSHDSKQGLREFMAEVSSIGRLKHKGLVPMRGWCRRGTELMLVYDYMPNGSLNKWIFDDAERLLDWEGRQKVLVDVAEALHYLHHGWDQVVLHRDIKAGNILLDSEMRGRLGDFGLAKLYQHGQAPSATRVVGTLGYLAPELARLPAPTAASDVYGFGVVALEVACGRRPIDGSSDDEPLLVDWVRGLYDLGKLLEAADVRLEGHYDVAEMELVLKLGLACCHPIPENRPTMKDVVELLIGEKVAIQVGVMTCVA